MIREPIKTRHTEINIPATSPQPSTDHLIPLQNKELFLWRAACIRGAGFPVTKVLQLAAPHCAQLADQLLQAEENAQHVRRSILDELAYINSQLRQHLSSLPKEADEFKSLNKKLKTIRKVERRLFKGQHPSWDAQFGIDETRWQELQKAAEQAEASQAAFAQAWGEATQQLGTAVRDIAQDERFREAVLWQNRKALHTGIDALLKTPVTKHGKKERRREELIANYIQRYAVKNDTIGFFGPSTWINIGTDPAAITVELGPNFVTDRKVYFEDWGISALADTLASNFDLRPWVIPRRMPYLHIEGKTLHLQAGETITLSPAKAAVFKACNGKKTARQIAKKLKRNPLLTFKNETEVFTILEELQVDKRIIWRLEIPTEGVHPEHHLRRLLEGIDDEQLRLTTLNMLDELEKAREVVAAAAGKPQQLDEAMTALETTFTHLTNSDATRRGGQTYAARTLLYEDCRRDTEITLGHDFVAAIEKPLTLLLTSTRWFTYELAQRYKQALHQIFEAILAQTSAAAETRRVDLSTFWLWSYPLFWGNEKERPAETLLDLFQEKWASVLAYTGDEKQLIYNSDELQAMVAETFYAPEIGWQTACYQNPDVMVAAQSPEAIRQGDYLIVLGELHMGINTLTSACFFHRHPHPEQVHKMVQADCPNPTVLPVASRDQVTQTTRTQFVMTSPRDVRLAFAHDAYPAPGNPWLLVGEMVVEEIDGELVVRTRNGRYQFSLIETFAQLITKEAVDSFQIIPSQKHTPRLTIDRLVVRREAWKFTPDEIPFAHETDEEARFLAARQWKQSQNLPRFLFIKVPIEKKPFYFDFDSPIYVRILARMIRQTMASEHANPIISMTEMLPNHEEAWLHDADGQRYTSELRIVAVDRPNKL